LSHSSDPILVFKNSFGLVLPVLKVWLLPAWEARLCASHREGTLCPFHYGKYFVTETHGKVSIPLLQGQGCVALSCCNLAVCSVVSLATPFCPVPPAPRRNRLGGEVHQTVSAPGTVPWLAGVPWLDFSVKNGALWKKLWLVVAKGN
jgi:hypothetical protein